MDVIRDCSPTRPKMLLEQISVLRKTNELCDVVLNVGVSKIRAHKIILSASSPYFRAMFCSELAESKQQEIKIKDIDEYAMEILIDYCYTSKITVDEKSVQTVLPAACLLQVIL
jgi:kelch-like protein 20